MVYGACVWALVQDLVRDVRRRMRLWEKGHRPGQSCLTEEEACQAKAIAMLPQSLLQNIPPSCYHHNHRGRDEFEVSSWHAKGLAAKTPQEGANKRAGSKCRRLTRTPSDVPTADS